MVLSSITAVNASLTHLAEQLRAETTTPALAPDGSLANGGLALGDGNGRRNSGSRGRIDGDLLAVHQHRDGQCTQSPWGALSEPYRLVQHIMETLLILAGTRHHGLDLRQGQPGCATGRTRCNRCARCPRGLVGKRAGDTERGVGHIAFIG